MQLTIPSSIEVQISAQALLTGKTPETVALEALQEKFSAAAEPAKSEEQPARKLTAEEWKAGLLAFVARQPRIKTFVDDSRESIYEGCGE